MALCLLSVSFYLYGYRTLGTRANRIPAPPARALIFLGAFLGAPLARRSGTSQLAAAMLIGTFAAILFFGAVRTSGWDSPTDRAEAQSSSL
jgi:hypothetical protein